MTSKKGGSFERDFCRNLSLWWTDGERDDVFWRTAGSGARATVRARVGKRTFGQYGDVQATDPIGQPLMDATAIELKRGYGKITPYDCLELKTAKKNKVSFYQFMMQAEQSAEDAGTEEWWLVTKRDRREAVLHMPYRRKAFLYSMGIPVAVFSMPMPSCVSVRLDDFFREVDPQIYVSEAQ